MAKWIALLVSVVLFYAPSVVISQCSGGIWSPAADTTAFGVAIRNVNGQFLHVNSIGQLSVTSNAAPIGTGVFWNIVVGGGGLSSLTVDSIYNADFQWYLGQVPSSATVDYSYIQGFSLITTADGSDPSIGWTITAGSVGGFYVLRSAVGDYLSTDGAIGAIAFNHLFGTNTNFQFVTSGCTCNSTCASAHAICASGNCRCMTGFTGSTCSVVTTTTTSSSASSIIPSSSSSSHSSSSVASSSSQSTVSSSSSHGGTSSSTGGLPIDRSSSSSSSPLPVPSSSSEFSSSSPVDVSSSTGDVPIGGSLSSTGSSSTGVHNHSLSSSTGSNCTANCTTTGSSSTIGLSLGATLGIAAGAIVAVAGIAYGISVVVTTSAVATAGSVTSAASVAASNVTLSPLIHPSLAVAIPTGTRWSGSGYK